MTLPTLGHQAAIAALTVLTLASGDVSAQATESDIAPFNGFDVSNSSISTRPSSAAGRRRTASRPSTGRSSCPPHRPGWPMATACSAWR